MTNTQGTRRITQAEGDALLLRYPARPSSEGYAEALRRDHNLQSIRPSIHRHVAATDSPCSLCRANRVDVTNRQVGSDFSGETNRA